MEVKLNENSLKEALHYDPETGIFTWLERPVSHFKNEDYQSRVNKRAAGKVAGTAFTNSSNKSYLVIGIFKRQEYLHRLAFLYMEGELPSEEVDHIDGNGMNNAWSNLRRVTHQENMKNRKLTKVNANGFPGVSKRPSGRWRARIKVDGNEIQLGTFDTYDEAKEARLIAHKKYGFHDNHGKDMDL